MSFTLYDNSGNPHQFPNEIADVSNPDDLVFQMLVAKHLIDRFGVDANGKLDLSDLTVEDLTFDKYFMTTDAMNWISRACFFLKEKREEYEAWAAVPYVPQKDRFGKVMRPPEVGLKHLPILIDCDLIYPEQRKGFVPKNIQVASDNIQKEKDPYIMKNDFKDYGPLGEMTEIMTQNPILFAQTFIACEYLSIEYLTDFFFFLILEYRHTSKDVVEHMNAYYENFSECPELADTFRSVINLRKNHKIEVYSNHSRLMSRVQRDFDADSTEDDYDTDVEKNLVTGREFVEANYYYFTDRS